MALLSHSIYYLALVLLASALFIVLFSTVYFKSILIKLVAIEILVNLFICCVALWAIKIHLPMLLDICIALSLIMFLSTVAYCQLLLKRGMHDA